MSLPVQGSRTVSAADAPRDCGQIRALLHDIRGALWIAIGSLDVALGESDGGDCSRDSVQDALESCLEIVTLMDRLQLGLMRTARLDAVDQPDGDRED